MSCRKAFVDVNEVDYFQAIALCNKYGFSLLSVIGGKNGRELKVLFCLKETSVELYRDLYLVFDIFMLS